MAGVIIGCGVLIADKVKNHRQAKKAKKLEEAEQFETTKLADQQRKQSPQRASFDSLPPAPPHDGDPPSYDETMRKKG